MAGALRILLALGLLLAHAPVCKVAAVSPRAPSQTSRTAEAPTCCGKCAKKTAATSHPSTPKPRSPVKPACPTGSTCPLCGAPAAVVPETAVVTELAAPAVARLFDSGRHLTTDGFHTLLDRPPRV